MAEVVDLGRGTHLFPLPLPIPRLPTVNCYAFEADDGLVLIDPGGGHDDGYDALVASVRAVGRSEHDIAVAVCTHLHPDHMGLGPRLRTEFGTRFVMHATAKDRMDAYNDWSTFRERVGSLAARHGAGGDDIAAMTADEPRPDWAPPGEPPDTLVDDDDIIPLSADRGLQVVYTPGHDVSHICLVDTTTGAMFSGDHVLPRITPFVPYPPEDDDNLGTYMQSLQRVEDIDPTITYPAHGPTIERGKARARQIALHHERRLAGFVEDIRARPLTAWEAMQAAFRPNLPPLHARLALQETLAHLEYLRLRNRLDRIDDHGVWRYVSAGY